MKSKPAQLALACARTGIRKEKKRVQKLLKAELTQVGNHYARPLTLTATARLSEVTVSSSGPTDMDGSKMAPKGSTKEAVLLGLNVTFALGRYLVLNEERVMNACGVQ